MGPERQTLLKRKSKHIIADKHPDINSGCEAREQTVLAHGDTCAHCGAELLRESHSTANRKLSAPQDRPWLIWLISFGVWSVVALAAGGTIYTLYRATHNPMSFPSALSLEFCQILTYAPLTPFVFGFAARYPIRRDNWPSRSLLYLAGGLVFTAIHVSLKSATPYGFWDPAIPRMEVCPLELPHSCVCSSMVRFARAVSYGFI